MSPLGDSGEAVGPESGETAEPKRLDVDEPEFARLSPPEPPAAAPAEPIREPVLPTAGAAGSLARQRLSRMPPGFRPQVLWPAPSTAIAGVIGYPVRHSLSPRLQNAAFAVLGLDWCYVAFEVPPALFDKAVTGAAALGLRGLSVTMPHKDAAARVATRHSRQVRRLGAANTLIFEAGAIRAESCDGDGLLDDLRDGLGFDPAGRRCGVIGAGGAGRATVLALAEAGAAEVIVVNRTAARAWRSVALAPKVAHVGRPEELKGLDLIVQATPTAMLKAPEALGASPVPPGTPNSGRQADGSPKPRRDKPTAGPSDSQIQDRSVPRLGPFGLPISPSRGTVPVHSTAPLASQRISKPKTENSSVTATREGFAPRTGSSGEGNDAVIAGVNAAWFGAGQVVVDLVYDPAVTPFLLEAERHGATVRSGLGMLVHQAARQIRLFTGMEPPLEVMWAVVREQ